MIIEKKVTQKQVKNMIKSDKVQASANVVSVLLNGTYALIFHILYILFSVSSDQ